MNSFWLLDKVDLYKILCPTKLKKFERDHYKWFKKGDYIYFQNELAEKIFLVSKGKVKIVHYNENGDEVLRAILHKGEIFGEMALLGEKQREEFAIAYSSDTALCPINVHQMHDLMRKDQRFSLTIFKIIGLKMKRLERRLDQLFFKDAKTRLIEFITDLAEQPGVLSQGAITIVHPYTQKDIADLVGTRRETVSLLLKELKAEGRLDYSKGRLVLLDPSFFGVSASEPQAYEMPV